MDFHDIGREIFKKQLLAPKEYIPLKKWEDFPLYFTVEYSVRDFFKELGFWRYVFGMEFLSVSDDYAILKHPENTWTFSIKKDTSRESVDLSNIKVQMFTDRLDQAEKFLQSSKVHYTIKEQSKNQRYIELQSPNNCFIQVWSGWEEA